MVGPRVNNKNPKGGPVTHAVPPLIKRNMILFALSQTFTGAGMQFAYGFGPLMVMALTHSANLAGISVGAFGLSRFLVAYPVGRITDTYGRKPGIMLGLVLALAGGMILGTSMTISNFALFVVGLLVLGMGMNAAQQLRVAATDMFLPHRRAQALGYVALGTMVGLVISPLAITYSQTYAYSIGQDPLGLPWFLLPVLIVPGMIMIVFVRPDPKEIGMNLGRYYPGYVPQPRPANVGPSDFRARAMLRNPIVRLAVVSNCAVQANMSIVMVLTSLVLSHHGHSLSSIAYSHMFHSAGMFAFTIPLGRLSDRVGHGRVMIPGVAVAFLGAGLVAFTDGAYLMVTLGTFLVGLGWAAANVSATALIADCYPTHERGRAIGVNDSVAGGASVVVALVTGPLIQYAGLPAAGATAALVAIPPILMFGAAWSRGRLRRLAATP